MWRITNDSGVLYLGATVHMLRPGDLPLPEVFDEAYAQSEVLLFEADLGGLDQPEVQGQIAQGMVYGDGGKLSEHLAESTWQRLERYAASRGLAPQMLQPLRPSGVFLTLLGIEMMRLGATEEGVDMRLYRQALEDGKPVIGLETIQQHLEYLFSMGEEDPDLFMAQVIDELEVDSTMLDTLIGAWRRGDEAVLYDELVLQLKLDYEPLYRTLVLERNRLWWSQIEVLLDSPQTELVLVGAAHLVGPEGLLSRARGLGFTVEAMQ
uniref:TraB/GumN family protein n=1 Tax=Marinobacterium profundum TaxID=1714300 RepID=UPI00131549B9|nr:TraB/GumN family protein [Marinobacterium profundum]